MTLREYIAALDQAGILIRVRHEVDWKHELGRLARKHHAPVLFENVRDYPGFSVFTNGLVTGECMALAFGVEAGTTPKAIAKELRSRIRTTIAPEVVPDPDDLPVKVEDDNVDLTSLPVPLWHEADGGRYIGTWHLNVTKDPQSGSRNVGVYRMQILSKNTATVSASPRSHLSYQLRKSCQIGKDLAMAVAIGVPESVIAGAACAPKLGTDEYSLAGAIAQRAVAVVRCRSIDLEVPLESEIVLEGHISCTERAQDGPYMDYAGVANVNPQAFVYKVSRVSRRSDAIFRGTSIGEPGAEDHMLFSVLSQLGLVDFHGRRLKHMVQQVFLRSAYFRAFQLSGRIGHILGGNRSKEMEEK